MSITYRKENGNTKDDIISYALPGGSVLRDSKELRKANTNLRKRALAKKKVKAERFVLKYDGSIV